MPRSSRQKYGKDDILLEQLEFSFVTGFEHYLKTAEDIDHNTAMALYQTAETHHYDFAE